MSDELDPGQVLELRERARGRLTKIPGVLGVGFGLKEVGEQLTDVRALRVYVDAKKPLDELNPDEVIPAEIDGVPTDVLTVPRGRLLGTEDTGQHSPLLGGITISNLRKNAAGELSLGTLGCFATIDGSGGPKNVVLMSNHHILAKNGGAVGNTIYQPGLIDGLIDSQNAHRIAEIHEEGKQGPHPFTYPADPADPADPNETEEPEYYIDCGTAILNIDISSWCDCNCGVSYKNELRELNIGGKSKLEGVARAVDGESVYKSGRKTGGTRGIIADPLGMATLEDRDPPVTAENIILINSVNPPDRVFSNPGDSGSALVNGQKQLIGLVFGGEDPEKVPTPLSFACHIAPVLDLLKVTPISTQNPPVGPAGHASSSRLARVGAPAGGGIQDRTVELQERLRRTPTGAVLYGAFMKHRSEVVSLINRHRPTTIAWHRGKGPTFFAHFAENARHPEHHIPVEIEGVSRLDLFQRMEAALMASGSEPLRQVIAQHREMLRSVATDFDDLHELVGRFEERPAYE